MSSKTKQSQLNFSVCKTRSRTKQCFTRNSSANKASSTNGNILSDNKTTPRKKKLELNNSEQQCEASPIKRNRSRSCAENHVPSTTQNVNELFPIVQLERTPLKSVTLNSEGYVKKTPETSVDGSKNLFASPKKISKSLNFDVEVRRSPRKSVSESTAASFISHLSLNSPQSKRTLIGLHRPEFKSYHSLKSSFAQNFSGEIVGRETEIKALKCFLHEHLHKSVPGSLYISGAPGTGKTATVMKILEDMNEVKFKKINLNCMSMKSSKEIFASLAENLNLIASQTKKDIIRPIEKALSSSKVPILVILDEIDQLESKDQKVLYTLFEWPSLANSKLILVGIANMLDLTDRVLPRLQASRTCHPQLLHFPPYSKLEIVKIINERIKEADVGDAKFIKPSAIHFLAAKISSVAGDIRKALDVCRRAVELSEIEVKKQMRLVNKSPTKSPRKNSVPAWKEVDIPQILSIFNEVYGSRVTSEITMNPSSFPLQQKMLVCTLLLILKHSKMKEVNLGKFHEVYSRVCRGQKLTAVEQSEFFSLCTLLESRGMLQVKKAKELRKSKVYLRLNEEEAILALGDQTLLATVIEDKDSLHKAGHQRV